MINLFLLGEKGYCAIAYLNENLNSNINAIIIGQDPNIQRDYSEEIKATAIQKNIKYTYRTDLTNDIYAGVKLNIAIGWRWLNNSTVKLIVLHDSILPKYRGFNPLVSALINGDDQIGVTAIEASKEYDRGAILEQNSIAITYPIKIKEAIRLIAIEYAMLLNKIIAKYLENKLEPVPQKEEDASYSLWRNDEDYKIDWKRSSTEIKRFIDAVGYPYKGAYCYWDSHILRVFDAELVPDVKIVNRTPGKVIFKDDQEYVIVCGSGLLKITEFYNEQGKKVDFNNIFRIWFK